MYNMPVRINPKASEIIYGFSSHEIGVHLSQFVNSDYKLFKITKDAIYTADDSYLISNAENFSKINSFFKELFYICFSDSFLTDQGIKPEFLKQASKIFTPQRRYIYFTNKHKNYLEEMNISLEINLNWAPSIHAQNTIDVSRLSSFFNDQNSMDTKLISLLKYETKYIELIKVSNFQSFLFCEFIKALQFDIPIKQCKNCGLYFVPTGRSDSLYCSNYYKDTRKTCREIGISTVYKEKISNNDIHKIFNRFYKKMYARRTNKKLSEIDFVNWLDRAKNERDNAIKGKLSRVEFTKILNKLESES